jgi:hypothetical protein
VHLWVVHWTRRGCCAFATTKPAIANMFLQQSGPPSLMHSYNGMKVFFWLFYFIFVLFFFRGGGGLLGLLCPCVLGVTFFCMTLYLRPLSIRNAPCPHYFGLYTLGGLLRHVKSAHPHVSLVSYAS